ncbi:MAG: hypothetical protein IPG33_10190 [Betaproteobacteria bacterium]|nr:hypothetical protein [Betaproteobacteria bacterium]
MSILDQQRKDHDEIVALLEELRKKLEGNVADKRTKEVRLAEQRNQLQLLDYHLVQLRSARDLIAGRSPNTELEKGKRPVPPNNRRLSSFKSRNYSACRHPMDNACRQSGTYTMA